ncbi:O-antigen ligase family protein [Eggerthella guodeyinii]|uniref:O-antigen ligase family protein n=1 Tax=Eggerthella guodeyinii TaxID=2690837 RepID=A0A6L7ITW9_9ACTN|nr:O-antigen ligase family protein [Eggerthella guodeyinii]QOS67045.1 O-antigen ligase family protein [Eggerthella guodeyinii]
MISKKPLSHILFLASLYLFAFSSINREASLFGLDMRYFLIAIMIPALFFTLCDAAGWRNTRAGTVDKLFFVYYALILISSLSLTTTELPIDAGIAGNVAVLHGMNLLMLVLIVSNRKIVSFDSIASAICVSGCILGASQIAVYLGFDLGLFLQSEDVRTMAVDRGAGEHLNLFGQHFRVSGFAEDPNYACFFNVLCGAMAVCIRRKKPLLSKMALVVSVIGISLSWSRTVAFGSALAGIFVALAYSQPRLRKAALCSLPIAVAAVSLLLPILKVGSLQTMSTRYTLWTNAYHLFLESPLIGNGLTSFRTYNSMMQNGWYVHPHSSYWETLSEFGALAFIVLVAIFVFAMRETESPVISFLIAAFAVFSINFDCTYLQISIVVLALLPASSQSMAVELPKRGTSLDEKRRSHRKALRAHYPKIRLA